MESINNLFHQLHIRIKAAYQSLLRVRFFLHNMHLRSMAIFHREAIP
jgi:hypothetical protein